MRRLCCVTLLSLLVICGVVPDLAHSQDRDDPLFMLVLGDSVTMGVWADATLGSPKPEFYLESLRVQLHAGLFSLLSGRRVNDLSNAKKYAAIIDKNFGYISRKHLSALIGDQSYSIPSLLKQQQGRDVEVLPATVLAGCYELADAVFDKIDRFFVDHRGHKDPDLIFINFNAMDFVFNSTISVFEQNVKKTLTRLAVRFQHSTMVVTPLVDVVTLIRTVYDRTAVPARFGFKSLTCSDAYAMVGFDKAVGVTSATPPTEIDVKEQKLAQMQQVLDDELWALGSRSTSEAYEAFSGKVIRVGRMDPPDGLWYPYLAADCIHPNVEGQKLLGASIWQALEAEYL